MPHRIKRLRTSAAALLLGSLTIAPAFSAQDEPSEGGEARLQALLECRDITADSGRLACFDSAAAQFGAREALVVIDRGQIEQAEREGFGFNLPSLAPLAGIFSRDQAAQRARTDDLEAGSGDDGDSRVVRRAENGAIEEIELEIERVTTTGYNTQRLHMTNGQVWTLTEGVSRSRLRARGGSVAIVRRAALGSYLVRIDGVGRAYRVRREE